MIAALVNIVRTGTRHIGQSQIVLLESNVGVGDQERAEDGIHDRVEGASGEGSDGEGNQTDADGAE